MKNLYLIAETACSHDGSVTRLKKIIDNVIKAEFEAIQIQIWKNENILPPNHEDIKILKKVEISYKNWKKIISYIRSKSKRIEIIACIYDQDALNFCIKNKIKIFKLHSSDLSNEILIKNVSKKAKRIDLSIGSSTEREITNALKWIGKSCETWLMYGYQLFPTDPNKINLRFLGYLKKKYKIRIGYQDHSPFDISSFTIPATAVGSGIEIIEKHVTDFNVRKGTDGQSAIEIKNFNLFVKKIKEAYLSLGEGKKINFSKEEIKYRTYSKKIILFSKNLKKDHVLKFEDFAFFRTGKKGEMIDGYKKFIGKRILKNVKKYEALNYKFINK
tara:strand:- start:12218 stop:13207 length:990 start_codon:yes stop_codon:yes gene_type:complete